MENADIALRLNRAADKAKLWWGTKRPAGWKKAKHLENPDVNCTTGAEKRLARAVAELVKLGW